MDFAAARKAMVDSQVRVNDVTDRALQAALLSVPRERFCAPERAFAAYAEISPEVTGERRLMGAREVSKLLQAAQPSSGERALALAAPYAAAVLAVMGLEVTAQEADDAVFDVTGEALAEAGAAMIVAPLNQPAGDDWDLIISEAATPVRAESWLAALRPGGRMVVVERSGPVGRAVLYVRGADGVSRRELFDASPAILTELAPPHEFVL